MSDPDPTLATPPASPSTLPPDTPQPPGRGLRIALAVSVAFNLAVLGLGAGMIMHGGPDRHGGDMVRDIGFGPFNDALRDDDRRALRDEYLAKMPDFRAERQRIRADAQAILAALRATPFDAAALEAAMTTMQDHMTARLDVGSGLIETFVLSLSAEDRLAFADRLEASLRRGPDGDDDGEGRGKGD